MFSDPRIFLFDSLFAYYLRGHLCSAAPNIGQWCERQWRVRHVRHVTMYMPGYVSGTAVSLFPQQSTAAATLLQQQQQQYLAALHQQQQMRSDLGRIYLDLDISNHFPCLSSRSKLIHRKEISQYHSMIGLLHSKYFPSLDIYFHSCYRLYFGVKNTIQPEFPLACIDNVYSIHNM